MLPVQLGLSVDVVSTSEEGTGTNPLLLLRTSPLGGCWGEAVGRLFAFKDRPVVLMAEHIY